ncbi:MAG: ATPase [Spirochaetes bacterium GWF1_31_7]|nr:MAG: ATPase [Spirochaetes bacterium GWE1_32_154]OHD46626.1 MAG: ATPase [Spirochaetes bacterium GWE2_31_10]OHD47640.1 MAG: ATPase [Spirochaetes bacterium GWF1_31_7]HBD94417.1 ATPase [Spirochaetia bacterium]HBI37662.1 ATPase [Spirochaetia bacterium]
MIRREMYLNKLIAYKNKNLIKVITGIRRCGKSTLMEIFQGYLLENGIAENQILSINFENIDFEELTDPKILHEYVKNKLLADKVNYLFFDEIQNVKDFQKVIDSLYIKKNTDIYITGSNAYMLSGELATLLSGRYVEIQMLPLSFKEYVSTFNDKTDLSRKYSDYLQYSSFPYAIELTHNKELIKDYLKGIYSTIVLKDVVARNNIADVSMLESVIRFAFDAIGNICSIKKISDTMTSAGRKISTHTVENYLSALINSFILYKAGRYDIKGKQHLKTGEKYYVVDIGLRYLLLGNKKADFGFMLENIIYLELLRRGYEVYVGKVDTLEVDFIALKNGFTEYYQVALTVTDQTTLERELSPFNKLTDHNPKYLLTLDQQPVTIHNGIQQINAIDWLLE